MFAWLCNFAFLYPLMMSFVWTSGAVVSIVFSKFNLRKSWNGKKHTVPGVTFLVPCHNESERIIEVVLWLARQNVADHEIIAVNDGSTDNTATLLDSLLAKHEKLRVIHLTTNQGKGYAMSIGAKAAVYDYIICIDGDAVLDTNAAGYLLQHFINEPNVGAVTGNPRVRNRSTLLGRIQVGEFSSIVGLLKRTQQIFGVLFTVSGVIVAFRKSALQSVGFWSTDTITDDIDISWKLQISGWDLRFEPKALCWVLMPESLNGLWTQRSRWARGGCEAILNYFRFGLLNKRPALFFVGLEYVTNIVWAYSISLIFFVWLLGLIIYLPPQYRVDGLIPHGQGVVLGVTCMLQIAVSLMIDYRYDYKLFGYLFWMIWYPFFYWLIGAIAVIFSLPKLLTSRHESSGIWVSPDRGIK